MKNLAFCLSIFLQPTLWTSAQELKPLVPVDKPIAQQLRAVLADPIVQAALQRIREREPLTIEEQLAITEIAAPPFQEKRRANDYLKRFLDLGLSNAYIDGEGNVVGYRRGSGEGPTLLIAAHLDTVFPESVDTTVELRGGRYYAPGIGDDTRGLAVLLSVIDVMNHFEIATVGDIIFSGNVGEEGRGDLRGVKALFRDLEGVDGFISVDGVRLSRITAGGTGSRRFEFIFSGPGGHSFGAFGLPSAIHAMGRAIAYIAELQTPQFPRTTFTVGTVTGGTSVNSIAADAKFAIDMRSNNSGSLAIFEQQAKQAALTAVLEENSRWGSDAISVEFELIGDRPVGSTSPESPIVQVAAGAYAKLDVDIGGITISSTDSNVPMALGIPAITISGGGDGGGAHSPAEWFKPVDSHLGPQAVLINILTLVGVLGVSDPVLANDF
ncbi:MAG TPA: peptidase M20 [Gammaproteobacteria bacterium]|nr:peptidase M20 [Gammaproteobacteria bacterium]|tara:strand:- start:1662 stop:2978 length:1317 start_codon:yes stop_codon:yes gene_type:complete